MEEETKLETPEEKAHRKERERFMRQAITQAKKAEKLMEVPIGCVIVYEGKVIARGYNRRNTDKNTLSHAELNAIRKASKKLGDWRLEGCTLYVTLEPCQMCAGAIVQARVSEVVIGSMNPKAGCAGSILNISQFRRLLLSMMQLHEKMPDGYLLTFQRELFTFLDLLYTKFSEKSPLAHHPMSSRTQTRLDTILTYTQENYQRPITLKEAADVVSLQPEYFCRFFRQNMETTYLEYLNSYRLSRIYRDLIATDLPVGTLAEKHGFTNDKLFHRLFRERFHTTPLQLRKAAREKGS